MEDYFMTYGKKKKKKKMNSRKTIKMNDLSVKFAF